MPRQFDVPAFYRSPLIESFKKPAAGRNAAAEPEPAVLDLGPIQFLIARRFGFCFGVENALEMIYRIVTENQGRRIFLISELIHNPAVNSDLVRRGVGFLLAPDGRRLIDFDLLSADDIVVVPAFGATLEVQHELAERGVDIRKHDATCPFVKKVWKRAAALAEQGFTVIIHGKFAHEETQATFSHTLRRAPTLVLRDYDEARFVCATLKGEHPAADFFARFGAKTSKGFALPADLQKVGIVNQTTMLASETQAIADLFRQTMLELFGENALSEHYADTQDTLCYATYENQSATAQLTRFGADLALVVGGYNSSNTGHLVELCAAAMPTYFIKDEGEIIDRHTIRHFRLPDKMLVTQTGWLPETAGRPARIAITAGASCPDRTVEAVIGRVAELAGCSPDRPL